MNKPDNSTAFAALQDQDDRAMPPQAGPVASGRSVVQQYWTIAVRWRRQVFLTVAGFLIAGVVTTLLMTPKYTAASLIEIAREGSRIAPVQGVERETTDQDLEFYQTQYGLLQSNELAEGVVDELRLANDPQFFALFRSKIEGASGDRLDPARRDARRRQAAQILLKNISINPVRLSRLVSVSFTSPDAALSARVVNAWTKRFIRTTLERRYEATSYARNFLESRLGQLRLRVEESERRLVDYASRERLITIPAADGGRSSATGTGERSIIADNLATLNAELTSAEADRIRQGSRLQSAANGAVPEALQNSAISGLRQRRAELAADYQKLMVQFEPDYPAAKALKSQLDQLDRSIAREEGRISSSIRNSYRDSTVREAALNRSVDQLKNDLLDQRRRSIQYNIYQREADTNRQLYDALLQRYKEIGVASGVGVNNISIVDEASVPTRPSSPRFLLNLVLAGLAGLAAGALLAFFLEQTHDSLDDPSQVADELQIPLLGVAPKVVGSTTDAILDRKSELTEAYLSVETNLRFATLQGVPQSLSVTSSRPAEGKSTTSLAVATQLAHAGKNVLLIDGDMRAPSVHGLLALPNDVGLSDVLVGARSLDQALARVEGFGLTVMTSGPKPPNAAELLIGDRFGEIVSALADRFDHVVIDSPPVMGLADALLIGSRVDGVIFAIESHAISRSAVLVALQRLRAARVRVFGGVLVKFEATRSHLGYGYDYGYGYGRDGGASRRT